MINGHWHTHAAWPNARENSRYPPPVSFIRFKSLSWNPESEWLFNSLDILEKNSHGIFKSYVPLCIGSFISTCFCATQFLAIRLMICLLWTTRLMLTLLDVHPKILGTTTVKLKPSMKIMKTTNTIIFPAKVLQMTTKRQISCEETQLYASSERTKGSLDRSKDLHLCQKQYQYWALLLKEATCVQMIDSQCFSLAEGMQCFMAALLDLSFTNPLPTASKVYTEKQSHENRNLSLKISLQYIGHTTEIEARNPWPAMVNGISQYCCQSYDPNVRNFSNPVGSVSIFWLFE